jgi:uncharacterized protein YbjT (DUF2867 family)
MKALIAGASGMIGGIALKELLSRQDVQEVIALVRRPLHLTHPKLKQVQHEEFSHLEAIETEFNGVDIAFFCIGVYTGSVPNPVFKEITVDQPVAFGEILKAQSPEASLCFLSGQGADNTEKSKVNFARYKGRAENRLMEMDFKRLHIFRPAYIYPVEKRPAPNMMYRISRILYPLLKGILPNVTSVQLARAMVQAAISGAPKTILENQDIKAIPLT